MTQFSRVKANKCQRAGIVMQSDPAIGSDTIYSSRNMLANWPFTQDMDMPEPFAIIRLGSPPALELDRNLGRVKWSQVIQSAGTRRWCRGRSRRFNWCRTGGRRRCRSWTLHWCRRWCRAFNRRRVRSFTRGWDWSRSMSRRWHV